MEGWTQHNNNSICDYRDHPRRETSIRRMELLHIFTLTAAILFICRNSILFLNHLKYRNRFTMASESAVASFRLTCLSCFLQVPGPILRQCDLLVKLKCCCNQILFVIRTRLYWQPTNVGCFFGASSVFKKTDEYERRTLFRATTFQM